MVMVQKSLIITWGLLFFSILLMTGCATIPSPRYAPFEESDLIAYSGSGDSTIIGQAFLKTRGGDVKYGAGNEVVLVPVTPYTQEIHDRVIINNERLEPPDQRYYKYRRTTIADGQGNFEFKNIPAGKYFLSCIIKWEVGGRYTYTTGGTAHAGVSIKPGETIKVVLIR
jgi:hypothetical protein